MEAYKLLSVLQSSHYNYVVLRQLSSTMFAITMDSIQQKYKHISDNLNLEDMPTFAIERRKALGFKNQQNLLIAFLDYY